MIRFECLGNSPVGLFNYKWFVEVSDATLMFSKINTEHVTTVANIRNCLKAFGTIPSNTHDIDKVTNIESVKCSTLKVLHG